MKRLSTKSRIILLLTTVATIGFLYLPLAIIGVLSFNKSGSTLWPPHHFTTKWWSLAINTDAPTNALLTSIKVAVFATLIALVLGTLAAFAMSKTKFFGKQAVSYLLVLPIALPGIITAVALKNTFVRTIDLGFTSFKIGFGIHSIVIAHATFCIVVTYNNVVARLRRISPNLASASADLGAKPITTFLNITFPLIRSALIAGAILAFALSFDEIVVTSYTSAPGIETLPQWIFNNFGRAKQVPLVNVMATFVMVFSIPLAWIAQRLSENE